jgi:hypothetical protein
MFVDQMDHGWKSGSVWPELWYRILNHLFGTPSFRRTAWLRLQSRWRDCNTTAIQNIFWLDCVV